MITTLLERKTEAAPNIRFEWRGSIDGITWSPWRTITEPEIEATAIFYGFEGYHYCQMRRLSNGVEDARSLIESWDE